MLRIVLVAGLCQLFSVGSSAQLKKFYTLKETWSFDTVDFTLKAASGNSYIKNLSQFNYPMVIYGNPDLDRVNPSFKTKFVGKTCYANLELSQYNSRSFGDGFSFVVSKKDKKSDNNYWKILIDNEKVYRLNMNYGFGNTEIDLADVKLDDLRLSSGSANVKIGYKDDQTNLIMMDTFFIKVDFGSIETMNLGNARAKNVIADVGFGTALLDFSTVLTDDFRCNAKVGAGSLDVVIPHKDAPVIIYLKDSPFCGIRMDDDFEEVEDNVYVNHSYSAKAKNLMVFDIDVALGNVSFTYSE